MAIADRDLDPEKKIAINDQNIADQSCLGNKIFIEMRCCTEHFNRNIAVNVTLWWSLNESDCLEAIFSFFSVAKHCFVNTMTSARHGPQNLS